MFFQRLFISLFLIFSYGINADSIQESRGPQEPLQDLESELKKNEQVEMEKMVQSRGYMIADWSKYAEEIKEVHQLDVENQEIEKDIQRNK